MRTIALTFAVFSSLRQHPRQNSTNWATKLPRPAKSWRWPGSST